MQVAFTVVRYTSERYGKREGVATSWLNTLCAPLAASHGAANGSTAPAGDAPANGGAASPTASPIRLPIFLRRGGAQACGLWSGYVFPVTYASDGGEQHRSLRSCQCLPGPSIA